MQNVGKLKLRCKTSKQSFKLQVKWKIEEWLLSCPSISVYCHRNVQPLVNLCWFWQRTGCCLAVCEVCCFSCRLCLVSSLHEVVYAGVIYQFILILHKTILRRYTYIHNVKQRIQLIQCVEECTVYQSLSFTFRIKQIVIYL